MIALGGVVLGLGAYYFFSARSATKEANDRCPTRICDDPESAALGNKGLHNANVATVLLPTGLGVAGVGVVLLLTLGGPDASASLSPWLLPGSGGLVARGSF